MTDTPRYRTLDANEAVADVAYRLSEVIAIYPITPASVMGEHADSWSADRRANLWGAVPEVVEMQSEGGAAGAVHGALQAGALTTTFTASQGLLLMLPDLFKIAGELTSFCMHVAARTVATHALSIFGDHSDVMAARSTGVALLASGTAQEAQDLAAIGHAATLLARVPILHFFDGFRTSHEITKVVPLEDATLRALLDEEAIRAHRARALNPDRPVVRGTSQNPDAYFQSREAVEPFYARFPAILDRTMARFAELTGRRYRLFDYVGHPEAERVIVLMGSGAECAHETALHLVEQGERVGVLKVRLFRPFSVEHLLAVLPKTARAITVLDRTKEPGSSGEPLLHELTSALVDAVQQGSRATLPRLAGGRYGLASKELTPAMVKAVFDEMDRASPKRRFTVGIRDDVSGSSRRGVSAVSDWLAHLSTALEGAPIVSLGAAMLLGAASVVISPCHLAGVPLVVGVVQAHRGPKRSAHAVALLFGLGVLLSFGIVGGLTVAAGRIAGDLGRFGNLLGAAVFIAFGLQLLEIVELPWFRSLTTRVEGRTARPTLVGFLFGASLGPCTFSFMAPALGVAVALGRTRPLHAAGLLLAFALAHTAVVTAAGVFGGATERFLDSHGATRAVAVFRRGTGVALIFGGLYFLYSMR